MMIRLFLFSLLLPQLGLSQIDGVTPQNIVLSSLMNDEAICKISLIQYWGEEEATIQTWDKKKNVYRFQSEFEPVLEAPFNAIDNFGYQRLGECDSSFVVKTGLSTREFSYNRCTG